MSTSELDSFPVGPMGIPDGRAQAEYGLEDCFSEAAKESYMKKIILGSQAKC